ncbi:hypothetical protein QQF64_035783 [Cirrhinus molitorella]|uniref:Uncharacterized protein n=1 Tax=Cirrhinus molitorella TaxID=172907 RepID=A0ABR3NHQ9_9TELE
MQAQTLFHQDLFHSFEAMKTAAPGMSVKAFTAVLDQRTKQFEEQANGWQQKTLQVQENKPTAGKAMCGESHWTAARETLKQANKLDEEGVEIAVCRHGFLLKDWSEYV